MGENENKAYKGIAIQESDRLFTKNFGDKHGDFEVRMPLPSEKVQIFSATSRALSGASLDTIKADEYEYTRMVVTLNHVLTDNVPSWWTGAENCPDDDFLFKLWKFYLESEKKFKDGLKKNI